MICPDWQYPHCGTSSSIHAFCSGCERLLDSPSMVVTCFPSARDTGATHERIAFPSKCTVQAPQSAIPQPNFVPVSPSESRRTHSSGVDGSTSTWTGFPFTKKFVIVISPVRMATLVSLWMVERNRRLRRGPIFFLPHVCPFHRGPVPPHTRLP